MRNSIYILLIVIFNAGASIFLKLAAKETTTDLPKFIFLQFLDWKLIAGLLLYGLAFIFYAKSLTFYNLNYVQPVTTSGTIVMVLIASKFIFSENLSALNLVGVMLILCGVILATIGN